MKAILTKNFTFTADSEIPEMVGKEIDLGDVSSETYNKMIASGYVKPVAEKAAAPPDKTDKK